MNHPTFNVLIADDEPIIREGIRNAVNWEALGLRLAAEAEDGEEALEAAVRHDVRIALVDINMPIVDGLELIRRLRKRLPECRAVIITGHDEFAYAQEAIRLGVEDYILKPADPEELNRLLGRIRDELETSMRERAYLDMASRQIEKHMPLLRERFCREWAEGALSAEEIRERLRFLQLPETPPAWVLLVRWTEPPDDGRGMRESDRQLYAFAVENIASEWLAPYPHVLFRDAAERTIGVVWDERADGVFPGIEMSIRDLLRLDVRLHAEPCAPCDGLTAVADAYQRCRQAAYREATLSPIVRRARQYMMDHYHECDLTLEKMAENLKTSPSYLGRLIKQELGVTFVAYLTRLRVRKAAQLLHATDLPIHEIASRVGYETQHYFSTAFKKATGVSPLRYRKGAAPAEPDEPS